MMRNVVWDEIKKRLFCCRWVSSVNSAAVVTPPETPPVVTLYLNNIAAH